MVRGNDYTGRRPHVQGSPAALGVRGGGGRITDAGGLVVVRRLWDALGLGRWIDDRAREVPGRYRPSLMVELWVVLLLYGGGAMDDLPLLERRGVRRIFGWTGVPHPATFGHWLRCSAAVLSPLLDGLLWRMVRRRWEMATGAPRSATVVMDSTAVGRYGLRQAGAEKGYNPKKPGPLAKAPRGGAPSPVSPRAARGPSRTPPAPRRGPVRPRQRHHPRQVATAAGHNRASGRPTMRQRRIRVEWIVESESGEQTIEKRGL